jgi:hypothetical protein
MPRPRRKYEDREFGFEHLFEWTRPNALVEGHYIRLVLLTDTEHQRWRVVAQAIRMGDGRCVVATEEMFWPNNTWREMASTMLHVARRAALKVEQEGALGD